MVNILDLCCLFHQALPPTVMTEKEVATRAGQKTELVCNITSDVAYNASWHRILNKTLQGIRKISFNK